MSDPLAPLSVDPNDFIWIDVETRSTEDVTVHGAARHCANGRVTVVAYAIGDGPVKDWCLTDWTPGKKLSWAMAPADLLEALARVRGGTAWFVAWNAAFEYHAFTRGMRGLGFEVHWMIDAMAQAMRSHLPADLKGAAKAVGLTQKQDSGKALIKMFAVEGNGVTPQTHPAEWEAFRSYARDDVAAMRDVFNATMPLHRRMWEEYWASERINHRGVAVDLPFVRGAAALAVRLAQKANADVETLTGGKIRTVRQNAAMLDWIRFELRHLPEVDRILTREYELIEGEDGGQESVAKYSLGREKVEALIAYLERLDDTEGLTDAEWNVLQVLEVRLYGASATPAKYQKILNLVDGDGRLKGQYVYCGAPATTRFSSKAVQIHNLSRDTVGSLDDEVDAIELIAEKGAAAFVDIQKKHGYVGKALSRLIRPAFIAPPKKTLVFTDLSSIEAVVCPWLTDDEDAEPLLEGIRAYHRDPSLPDMYRIQAGKMLGKDPFDITKGERQSHGKTVQLAMQFLGGVGSLHNMGRIYRVHFDDDEAKDIVDRWRAENKWAVRFGERVWEGVLWCMENPGEPRTAGRITLVYDADYLRGTLFAVLPNGDPLLYTGIAWRDVTTKDKETGAEKTEKRLTVRKGRGIAPIWKGEFCLAADTQVLTNGGWKPIVDVSLTDLVWDGIEFVTHDGLCFQGKKCTIPLNGVRMTPNHKVLTEEHGWYAAAQCEGLYGVAVRMPDGCSEDRRGADQRPREVADGEMAFSVRLRIGGREDRRGSGTAGRAGWLALGGAVRAEEAERRSQDARHVEAPGLHCVAECEAAVRTADLSCVAQLRGTRNQDVRPLADVRELLVRHGADMACRSDAGPREQRRALRTRQLPLGGHGDAGSQSSRCAAGEHGASSPRDRDRTDNAAVSLAPEPVYDLLNAGPRSRFVVRGDSGPFIVSNCNNFTQATAAALLRNALRVLDQDSGLSVVMHTHDEICVEVPLADVDAADALLLEVMTARPDWAPGLPIAAEPTRCDWYTKTKG
jgi:hypothetical protein